MNAITEGAISSASISEARSDVNVSMDTHVTSGEFVKVVFKKHSSYN